MGEISYFFMKFGRGGSDYEIQSTLYQRLERADDAAEELQYFNQLVSENPSTVTDAWLSERNFSLKNLKKSLALAENKYQYCTSANRKRCAALQKRIKFIKSHPPKDSCSA